MKPEKEERICKGGNHRPCTKKAWGKFKFCYGCLYIERNRINHYLVLRHLPYTGYEPPSISEYEVIGIANPYVKSQPIWLDKKGWEDSQAPVSNLWVDPIYPGTTTSNRAQEVTGRPVVKEAKVKEEAPSREEVIRRKKEVLDKFAAISQKREQEYINWSLSLPGLPTGLHDSIFYRKRVLAEQEYEEALAEYNALVG